MSHPLYGDVLRAMIPPMVRRYHRRTALLCLVAVLSVKGDTVEAVDRAEAVQAELTVRPEVPAIWRAQLLFSLAVALRFYGRGDDALTRTGAITRGVPLMMLEPPRSRRCPTDSRCCSRADMHRG